MNVNNTSGRAYHEIKENGLLTAARFKVYEYLTLNGPQTGNELDRALGGSAHKRLSELAASGLVRVCGSKKDPYTGMENNIWEVIPDVLPTKPVPTPTQSSRPTKAEIMQMAQEVNNLMTSARTTPDDGPKVLSPSSLRVLAWMKQGAP